MFERCCWDTFNTDNKYHDRLVGGIRFISFPKPARQLEKAKRWIRLCGRPHNQLNESILNERGKAKHLYDCSKRFIDGTLSNRYPDPIPAVATSYYSVIPTQKPPTKRMHACTDTRNASCEEWPKCWMLDPMPCQDLQNLQLSLSVFNSFCHIIW